MAGQTFVRLKHGSGQLWDLQDACLTILRDMEAWRRARGTFVIVPLLFGSRVSIGGGGGQGLEASEQTKVPATRLLDDEGLDTHRPQAKKHVFSQRFSSKITQPWDVCSPLYKQSFIGTIVPPPSIIIPVKDC